jgi:hypothetical protein
MWPFKKKERLSMVLIAINSSSVCGAYAHYSKNEPPTIYFSVSKHISPREHESQTDAMLRTLDDVGHDLIETGAPTLRRETGSGHADGVLVSVADPWQQTAVHTQTIQPGKQFTFTRAMLSEIIASSEHVPDDRISFGESVIATILNGYDIPNPIGKKANRAEVIVLSSTLEKKLTETIHAKVRKLYHTHDIAFTAFAPVAYTVLRSLYPHEKDFLVLNVETDGTDLSFVKNGVLVDVGSLPQGLSSLLTASRAAERMTIEEEAGMARRMSEQPGYLNPDRNARFSLRAETARDEWVKSLADRLKTFANQHPLPRTLFLLTEPAARDYLKRALDSHVLHALWLSDEPLAIISITPEQFSSRLRTRSADEISVFLSILALYQQKQTA